MLNDRNFGHSTPLLVGAGAWSLLLALASAAGCGGPKYPSCDKDEDCTSDGHHGVCLEHTCVECRDDAACGTGKSCRAGACAPIEGYCDAAHACPAGQNCSARNRCEAPVAAAPPVECDDSHSCSGSGKCENGHCVAPVQGGPGCTDFPAAHFDYDSPALKGDGRQVLQRLANCLGASLKGGRVLLTGHCDNRGESEYNMSLGADRAEAVKTFLVGLGVPSDRLRTSSRGELDASGSDEAGWSNDRRVDIEVR